MKTVNGDKLAFTVQGACEATDMARTRIYAAIADGTLKTFKAGRRRMVSARALNEFIMKLERDNANGAAA